MGLKQFVLCWVALAALVSIGLGILEYGILLIGPVSGYLMLLAFVGAPVAAYLLVTRRDVDVRRLWLFVGIVYVLGLGPYALFQAHPLLPSVVVGLALRAGALIGVLAGGYYLVYEQRVDDRVTS